jgi:hypothetical protein
MVATGSPVGGLGRTLERRTKHAMAYINLTPHSIDVYPSEAFTGLDRGSAESVDKAMALMSIPSSGALRIGTKVEAMGELPGGIPADRVVYSGFEGLPDSVAEDDILIVSMPAQSYAHAVGHQLADQMVIPAKVVRLKSDGSKTLGCQGLSYYQAS